MCLHLSRFRPSFHTHNTHSVPFPSACGLAVGCWLCYICVRIENTLARPTTSCQHEVTVRAEQIGDYFTLIYDARVLQQLPSSSKSTFQKVKMCQWLSWGKEADYSHDLRIRWASSSLGQVLQNSILLILEDSSGHALCPCNLCIERQSNPNPP